MHIRLLPHMDFSIVRNSLTDLTLVCEGGYQIHTHKLVLAVGSEYFKTLFTGSMKVDTHVIHLPDVDGQIMSIVVDYLYQTVYEHPYVKLDFTVGQFLKLYTYVNKYMFTAYHHLDNWIFTLFDNHPSITADELQDIYTYFRQTTDTPLDDENELFSDWIVDLIKRGTHPDISAWEEDDIRKIIARTEYRISEVYNEFDEMWTTVEHGQAIHRYILNYVRYMKNEFPTHGAYRV